NQKAQGTAHGHSLKLPHWRASDSRRRFDEDFNPGGTADSWLSSELNYGLFTWRRDCYLMDSKEFSVETSTSGRFLELGNLLRSSRSISAPDDVGENISRLA